MKAESLELAAQSLALAGTKVISLLMPEVLITTCIPISTKICLLRLTLLLGLHLY